MDEYITKDEAIKAILWTEDLPSNYEEKILNRAANKVRMITPTEIVEKKLGYWEYDRFTPIRKGKRRCSECGHVIYVKERKLPNFCSECGADMRL